MKSFEIGPGLTCDLERLVTTRLLVQANSGGGKSWLLRRLLEQTAGKIQQLVIDPEGEFSTLRERFDYVLAAKSGGDTAADPRTAKLLAERLLELRVSAILDIYELDPHARILFVRRFLEALVDAPKALWHPVIVVVDEAHTYCPEVGNAESANAVKALATRGRKRGFCAVFATQRLSKFAKDAAAECNNKLIGRTSLDVDMVRAGDELGFGKADRQQLREVNDGEFFAFGPALSRTVTRVMVGPVQTTHPEAGGRLALTAPPPTAHVKALLPKLADLPAEAADRERTLEELKTALANTKRELTLARKEHPAPAAKIETKVVEKPVLKDGHLARIESLKLALDKEHARHEAIIGPLHDRFVAALNELAAALASTRAPHPQTQATMTQRVDRQGPVSPRGSRAVTAAAARPAPAVSPPNGDGPLTGPEQRIVDAIAWMESIGITEPEQTAVAFLANYTYGAGAFNNPRGSLRAKGFVTYLGNRIALTDEGRALALQPSAPLTVEELHARVLDRLPGPEQRLLRPLLAAYPKALDNEALAASADYTAGAGAFNNPKGRLRSLGLIDYPQPGYAVAKPLLFLEDR